MSEEAIDFNSTKKIFTMGKQMNIPEFTTLREMAEFWDTHDITEFEDELIEVKEPIFKHLGHRVITVILDDDHYTLLKKNRRSGTTQYSI